MASPIGVVDQTPAPMNIDTQGPGFVSRRCCPSTRRTAQADAVCNVALTLTAAAVTAVSGFAASSYTQAEHQEDYSTITAKDRLTIIGLCLSTSVCAAVAVLSAWATARQCYADRHVLFPR